MWLLLVLVLTLLPLSGYSASSTPLSQKNATPKPAADPPIAKQSSGDETPVERPWPSANPYHPTSATNFDPFAAPLVQRPDAPRPINSVYGHFGDPLFPDSIKSRDVTDHPFAMDSSTNLYGRDQRMGRR
jgi:hypothetical protein